MHIKGNKFDIMLDKTFATGLQVVEIIFLYKAQSLLIVYHFQVSHNLLQNLFADVFSFKNIINNTQ